jgi:hypothetical protein
MPLLQGSSAETISHNISELTHHGSRKRSHNQIVAIALSTADKSKKKGRITKMRVRPKKNRTTT